MVNVKVRFKYGAKGQRPSVTTSTSIACEAKTESAVMTALRRKYPNYGEIIILEIS